MTKYPIESYDELSEGTVQKLVNAGITDMMQLKKSTFLGIIDVVGEDVFWAEVWQAMN